MNSNGANATNTGVFFTPDGVMDENAFVTVPEAFMKVFGEALEKDLVSEMAKGAELEPLSQCNNTINLEK